MICTAQTRSDYLVRDSCCAGRRQSVPLNARRGVTFAEMLAVIVVLSLFVVLAQLRLFGLLDRHTFKAEVQELVSTMQMAASAAAQSDRRYEVIIDIPEQNYLLREITNPDLSVVLEEEIILQADLSEDCRVAYVEFDDGQYANEGWAKFRAGRSGWAYGGKIVLLDRNEQPYSLVVNRLNRIVGLEEGDVSLLKPKAGNDIPF